MFKKVLIYLLTISLAIASELRIDATSPEKMQASYAKILASLDDDMQQKFALALTTIGVVMAQRADLGGSQKIMEMINGKTAQEIIAESKKLTGFVRRVKEVIKANTSAEFSTVVGNLLISLPEGKRENFSEAIAKLIYQREQQKTTESDFLKKVNGKTVDEIIEMAKDINVPFEIANNRKQKDYKLEKLSDKDLKKLGIKKNTSKKQNEDSLEYKNSLVPPASL
jgi:type III secretion system FlhB-like substrate exporter